MVKVVMALVSTAAGLILVLSFKSHTAGAPKSALAGAHGAPSAGPTTSPNGMPGTKNTKGHHAGTHSARGGKRKARKKTGTSGTFTGSSIGTPYGTMQVAAVLSNGKLTDVKVLKQTDVGGRSRQIDAQALPRLKAEALAAHSANIDAVSGATYTSRGYAQSLQAALDKAGH